MSWFKRNRTEAMQVPQQIPQVKEVRRVDNFAGLEASPACFPVYLGRIGQENLPKVVYVELMLEETLTETENGMIAKEFVLFPIRDMHQTKDYFALNTHTAEELRSLPGLIATDFSARVSSYPDKTLKFAGDRYELVHGELCSDGPLAFRRFLNDKGNEIFRNKNNVCLLETNTKYAKHGNKTYSVTAYNIVPALQVCLENSGLGIAAVTFPKQTSLDEILHKYDQRADPAIEILFPKNLAEKYACGS